ncbi:probable galacturonosyltransferase 3 isoform X1 [Aristolochia californica]|uniref:probable galacturonosyltransferase 3 isoform X1 n=2 Tax=Aristolochia californica TaxID=171875 RepID=UPI0035DED116
MVEVFDKGESNLFGQSSHRPIQNLMLSITLGRAGMLSDSFLDKNRRKENVNIFASYTDASGDIQTITINSKDLSDSWVWENLADKNHDLLKDAKHMVTGLDDRNWSSTDEHGPQEGELQNRQTLPITPVKLLRRQLRQTKRENRTAELIQQDKTAEYQKQVAAIEQSKNLNNKISGGKYSIWKREYNNQHGDDVLKLMRDQVIIAKAYASIAQAKDDVELYTSLMNCIQRNRKAIGEANSDVELHASALERAKAMGHVLAVAKDKLYDSNLLARKLRVMLQSTEDRTTVLKKQSTFLIQHVAKSVPKGLHCVSLELTMEYFSRDHSSEEELIDTEKLVNPTLYHYAIFSDNVLATSVVVNSTTSHAKEPENHVFHIVTDKLIFVAMKTWFLVNSPPNVTIQVENIDDFKWLNSSYCSVLRQLESDRLKEYYFKANHPTSLSAGTDNLKYRNPKYLSMLNHLRFYLPEVYPKLDKILFLDDDIVVQKDLTPLWSVELGGMVNGAVETCKESFHRFDKYLNFSNPKISENFDPNACGWAFGMNMFDLKEWRKRNITGVYHRWQDMNEDRTLWKLGSLPPGLITFDNLTHPLDRSWHVLGLGYDPALNQTEIENAGVIHYNGNYKPWLDVAVVKYRHYWSRYVMSDNPYLHRCQISDDGLTQ